MKARLATKLDKIAILNLLNELGKVGNKTSDNAESEKIGEIFNEIISKKNVFIFVVDENSEILALATLYLIPYIRHGSYRGHIEDFVVSKEFRNKGIGSFFIKEIKKYCKTIDISVIKLTSMLDNIIAHDFYEKNGGKHTEKIFRFDIK
ncbi:MAG: GCN5-related N-acetyltransferase [Candidatus Roizmanbacteria bacterium GW2011_GWA2_35_19]|uniref:GCN5-related N-acetyltransferase n=2 Tax=Candidatus Roizmaniibacteriota TaxID=1752723 RepID=A0A0G0ECJ5_9BACT|nr:MAG: GCN5-related N-acetyltransferase [Candidatus Roizmanbacteria bacterium GW2011_GWC2_35_12]KKP72985.1 MAG: GCN5-related N-acetyltransferase [Candidatus Roizmanbacteria bacterium GW2011_GWA2_35_19]